MLNIIYNESKYYVFEPRNTHTNKYNIIDNHLWLITRFVSTKQVELKEGDVVRFGRIPFKIIKLVMNPETQNESINKSMDEVS